jgi:hypothetical protein
MTFEGYVILDTNGMRIKCKNASYVRLHQLRGNNNIFSYKYLVPIVLKGEVSEVLTYFKELTEKLSEVENRLLIAKTSLLECWNKYRDLPTKKEFALAVKQEPFACLLFKAYEGKSSIEELWADSSELILDKLFRRKDN